MFFILFWRNQWYSLARTTLIVREPEFLLTILVKKTKEIEGSLLTEYQRCMLKIQEIEYDLFGLLQYQYQLLFHGKLA